MEVRRGALVTLALLLVASSSLATAAEGGLFSVESKVPVRLYGYVKLDASRDSSELDNGNFANWVKNEAEGVGNKDDVEFNMTARQTRLGLALGEADAGAAKVSGKVEIDFYGAGAGEHKNAVLLRHAFAELTYEDWDLSILFGQTSDVVSPLFAPTLNYTVMWWQGNIGYRRPQLRVTKGFQLDAGFLSRIELQVAATRNIGHAVTAVAPTTGEDSGVPGLQGRAAFTLNLFGDKPVVLGLFGACRTEEIDAAAASDDDLDVGSDLYGIDLTLPLTDMIGIKAEFFHGRNLDTYCGVGTGLVTGTGHEISSEGGWLAITLKPGGGVLEKFEFNLGAGVDNPLNEDTKDLGNTVITRNSAIFGNVKYDLGGGASCGLELMYMDTEYETGAATDATPVSANLRMQFSMMYKF
jgi:hypothetical protein